MKGDELHWRFGYKKALAFPRWQGYVIAPEAQSSVALGAPQVYFPLFWNGQDPKQHDTESPGIFLLPIYHPSVQCRIWPMHANPKVGIFPGSLTQEWTCARRLCGQSSGCAFRYLLQQTAHCFCLQPDERDGQKAGNTCLHGQRKGRIRSKVLKTVLGKANERHVCSLACPHCVPLCHLSSL